MPRTLPWLAEKAAKKESTAKAKVKRRSSSPADLVGSDLEDLDDEPARPSRVDKKKAAYREPSSSPPPIVSAPPPKEELLPGYAADDGWMMVEDEFYSMAQIYTQHLHQEAYVNLKKRHKARGQETLAALARATDGRTEQSRQLQLKLKAEENAKKRKQAMASDSGSEDDDEYMLDPQLAGLMAGSQGGRVQNSSRPAQARSRRSLAEDGDESSGPLPEAEPDLSPVMEENEDEDEDDETDSDDLGRPARKELVKSKATTSRPTVSTRRRASTAARPPQPKPPAPALFKQSTKPKAEEPSSAQDEPASSSLPSSPPSRLPAPKRPKSENTRLQSPSPKQDRAFTSRRLSPIKAEESASPANKVSHPAPITIKEEPGTRVSSFLAKRRAQREKEQAEAKRKDIEDSIPTFLF